MGVLGESSVVLIPAVHKPFGAVTMAHAQGISTMRGFGTSPPERIGLQGEYDYNGLARRVEHCFHQAGLAEDISLLRVKQRGCVVILTGVIGSRSLLNHLVTLAIKVDGAALVEIYRMRFTEEEAAA